MSLCLPTTLSVFSSTSAILLHPDHSNSVSSTPKWRKPINKHKLLPTFCSQRQPTTHRRNILLGLGSLTTSLAAILTTQEVLLATGTGSTIQEFGSQPRLLDSKIRVIVPKPKRSKKGKETAVLVVDKIDIKTDGPVRFDVYVSKLNGDYEMGVFAGSLVDLARIRVGRNPPKGVFEVGISGLLNEIGAEDDDQLLVTLQPRTGDVTVGGIYVDYRGFT